MLKKTLFFAILAISLLYHACDDKAVCTEMATAYLQTGFYKAIEGEEQDSALDNVTVYGLGIPEPVIQNDSNVKQLKLPLNFSSDHSVFVITNDTVSDTLYLTYDTTLTFVSYECGFAPSYDIQDVGSSNNGFDSVIIVKSLVETDDDENIKIYL